MSQVETETKRGELWRCPIHGIVEPHRFDDDWPDDTGYAIQNAEQGITHPCPILLNDESECCEQMTALGTLREEFFVIHAPGWPGGFAPVPQTLDAARRFVEDNGGTLRRRFHLGWRDDLDA